MKVAMGALAVLATSAASLQIPSVTEALHHFLEPTFARLALLRGARAVRRADRRRPGRRRGARRCRASSSPTRCGCSSPERPARSAQRFAPLHRLFVNKWYFDEVIDLARRAAVRLVRPLRAQHVRARRRQRRARRRHDRRSCAPARPPCARIQTGYLRDYAALLLLGLAGARPLLPDLPRDRSTSRSSSSGRSLLGGARRARAARRRAGVRAGRRARAARLRGRAAVRLRRGARAGCSTSPTTTWIPDAGHPLQARRRRAEPVAGRADRAAVRGVGAVDGAAAAASARSSSRSTSGWPRPAVLGAFLAQDLALFVLFFDLMLVPFYFLRRAVGRAATACAATMKLVIYTLVGSLLMLAAAVATAVLSRERGADDLTSCSPTCARNRSARARRSWIFVVLRARVPDQDAGVPAARLDARRATARCRCRCWRCSPACSRRSPPTASCASCCRSSPTRPRDFQS